jgi:hypothetical protein
MDTTSRITEGTTALIGTGYPESAYIFVQRMHVGDLPFGDHYDQC